MQTWTLDWAIRNFIAELLMPPGIWILMSLGALFFLRHRQILQRTLLVFALMMIWVSSTPAFAAWFTHQMDAFLHWPKPVQISGLPHHQQSSNQVPVQTQGQANNQTQDQIQAIIVLGGGRRLGAKESAEYSNQDLSKETLERVRMAAKLARQTGLPILTSGGQPDATDTKSQSEAEVMSRVLKNEYALNVKWLESQSHTTQENARYSFEMLKKEQVHRVYLVTHFWHMPRAQRIFEQQGFQVTAIPHGFWGIEQYTPLDFYPGSSALASTRQVWHEVLGSVWYRLRY
jgi:uncharacterized SAM-binding protein YcdF (DUF218 family)